MLTLPTCPCISIEHLLLRALAGSWVRRQGATDRLDEIVILGFKDGPQEVLLLGDGRGTFRPAASSPLPSGNGPGYLLVADVNQDGRLDILAANYQSGDLTVLLASDG